MYDPLIGRWTSPDPAASPWSAHFELGSSAPLMESASNEVSAQSASRTYEQPVVGVGRYGCCGSADKHNSASWKVLPMIIVIAHSSNEDDHTRNIRMDHELRIANNIWNQCCIQIHIRKLEFLSWVDTRWLLDNDFEYNQTRDYEGLRDFARKDASFLHAFYVKSVLSWHAREEAPVAGTSYPTAMVPFVVISQSEASYRTLAHEIGHVLMRVDHHDDKGNLMHFNNSAAAYRLTVPQCDKARQSPFVRDGRRSDN